MSQLSNNTTGLQEILEALQTKAAGCEQATPEISVSSNGLITATAGTKSSTKQLAFQAAKTITPTTASQIAVSSGYYTGGNVTVASVPTQSKTVTPTSSSQNIVPDSGKFLSNVTVTSVPTQTKTTTPTASTQNITPDSGKFLSQVTVTAIPSSYVIPSGTSTITANGTYDVKNYASAVVNVESSGGSSEAVEWSEAEDAIVTRTLNEYSNDRVTNVGNGAFAFATKIKSVNFPNANMIGHSAFYNCFNLTSVNFPVCTNIYSSAFYNCDGLTLVSFPVCTNIGSNAFYNCDKLVSITFPSVTSIGASAFAYCKSLTSVSFPTCTSIGNGAFRTCSSLTSVSFPKCTNISNYAFNNCYTLSSLTLGASTVCTLSNSEAFTSTPYAGYSTYFSGTPYIYVPSSLIASYQTATNWTYFSSYFSTIESLSEPSLITFTIDSTEYQAEEGMTWGEWCDSEYNTDGYYINNTFMTKDGRMYIGNGTPLMVSETIIQNEQYYLL